MRRMCPASAGCNKIVSKADVRCSGTKRWQVTVHDFKVQEDRRGLTLSAGFNNCLSSYSIEQYNAGVAAAEKLWQTRERWNRSCWSKWAKMSSRTSRLRLSAETIGVGVWSVARGEIDATEEKRHSGDAENLVGAKTEGPSLFDRRPPPCRSFIVAAVVRDVALLSFLGVFKLTLANSLTSKATRLPTSPVKSRPSRSRPERLRVIRADRRRTGLLRDKVQDQHSQTAHPKNAKKSHSRSDVGMVQEEVAL